MYERILVPTDGSEVADLAVEHARSLALATGAEVHLLFVADTAQDSVTVVGTDVVDALVTEGERVVDAAAERLADAGIEVETRVVQGDPRETIITHADDGVDLVVMGTHGRRGLERYLLGSVTEAVLRSTTVPVVVVGPEEDD